MNQKRISLLAALVAAIVILVLLWIVLGRDHGNSADQRGDAIMTTYSGHGGTFKNPIVDMDTPDPSVVYKDGFYYMTFTHNGADIMVMKSRTIDFRHAKRKVVWYPPFGTMYSANLWAPELQYIQGKWYIYFAADDGNNENHRMYVLEAVSDDPLGEYEFRGKVDDGSDKWAIDGLVMEHEEQLYFVWSGWEGDVNISQNTYIAPMSDPLTISGPRVLLSEPLYEWERAGGPPYIQEGQAILKHNGRLFIAYSGAGSWTPFYSIGLLALQEGGNPLEPEHWSKVEQPLMKMNEEIDVFGPGHNSFTTSPDGTETWIVYHATSGIHDGWNNRKARAERVAWDDQGMPILNGPLAIETAIAVPAGEGIYYAKHAKVADGELLFELIPSRHATEMPILLHYRSEGSDSSAVLFVNEEEWGGVELAETANQDIGYVWVIVPFNEGMNTIKVQLAEGAALEAIEITRYEAENAQAGKGAYAESNPFASGWGAVLGDSTDEGELQFSNFVVPEAGEYELRIAASNRGDAEQQLQISINGKKAKVITIEPGERQHFNTILLSVKLDKGINEIVIKNLSSAIALDYIDILKS